MASGDTLLVFTANHAVYMTDNTTYTPATFDVRNNHPVVDFDADANEDVFFEGILPRHYGGGGITVSLGWMASSATANTVVWSVQVERHQDDTDDLDSDSFAAAQTVSATAASASGEVAYDTVAFTDGAQMDSVAVGESFRLRVTRNATTGADTMAGDAELFTVEIRET